MCEATSESMDAATLLETLGQTLEKILGRKLPLHGKQPSCYLIITCSNATT